MVLVGLACAALFAVWVWSEVPEWAELLGVGTSITSVSPETPARQASAGETLSYAFDADTGGRLPPAFHAALTGRGPPGRWEKRVDSSGPSPSHVLAQLSTDRTGYRFPLAILDTVSVRDLDLRVKFKAVAGAPLAGFDVTFRHVEYRWSDVTRLRETLAGIGEMGAGVCSSEGGLFDYGSDEDIVGNLTVLRDGTPADFVVVGSVVRDTATLDPRLKATTEAQGRPLIRYLGLEAFRLLAQRAGWSVDRVIDSVAHHVVGLKKAM
jgi:hypothetical protein